MFEPLETLNNEKNYLERIQAKMKLNHRKKPTARRMTGIILECLKPLAKLLLLLIIIAGSTLTVVSPARAHEEEGDCFNKETGELTSIECAEADNAWQEFLGGVELITDYNQPGEPVVNGTGTYTYTPNMTPLGYNRRIVPASGPGNGRFNSDVGAFWGNYAYEGHYDGFRILDISDPTNPTQLINYTDCVGSQGDLVVWENLLIRSWDAPAGSTARCGGALVGNGFEGISIFDISNPIAPVLVRNLRMASTGNPAGSPTGCGSHTVLIVPDVGRGNLYVYSMASSGSCNGVDIVRIPLSNPANAVFLRREASGRACHDGGVILGDVNLLSCAGGNGLTTWSFDPSLTPNAIGGLEDPLQLWSQSISGVSVGHSATFTWDGKYIVFGHEPGGGSQAQCQTTSSTVNKSIFFFNARTGGAPVGSFVLPRPQTSRENCTWHYYNTVPTNRGYVLVAGNYQSGISVVDFTNPAAAQEIAYADPAPLSTTSSILGGDWATYWYNGYIYESDITRGLMTWSLDHRLVQGSKALTRYPSTGTQEFSIPLDKTAPVTSISLAPAAVNDWYVNPTVTLSADDGADGAGVDKIEYSLDGGAFTTYTDPFQVLGDGDHTIEYRSSDFALNVEATQSLSFKVDGTRPVTSVTGVANNAVYTLGSIPAAGCLSTDNLSGLAQEATVSVAGGSINGVGTFTATCSGAADFAGNSALDAVATYYVHYAGLSGFLQPINPDGSSLFNRGQSVPAKLQLAGDEFFGFDTSGWTIQKITAACGGSVGSVSEDVGSVTPSTQFRYDAASDQYIYNTDFRNAAVGSCWILRVTLDSGQVFDSAMFKIRR